MSETDIQTFLLMPDNTNPLNIKLLDSLNDSYSCLIYFRTQQNRNVPTFASVTKRKVMSHNVYSKCVSIFIAFLLNCPFLLFGQGAVSMEEIADWYVRQKI